MNETPGNSRVVSMVASLVEGETGDDGSSETAIKRTYRVVPSPPMGHSCAREIAMRYGISYEQLVDKLSERGVLKE